MPISQAGMSILEDKTSPFSNLKTVTTMLDTYDLTQNTRSVYIYGCDYCFYRTWISLPGDSQLLCHWFYNLISDSSLFICTWLTYFRRNNLPQTNDTSLTQKWIYNCHLVIGTHSHKDQQLRMRVCSPLGWVTVFQCFCLLQEPQHHIALGTSRGAPVLD